MPRVFDDFEPENAQLSPPGPIWLENGELSLGGVLSIAIEPQFEAIDGRAKALIAVAFGRRLDPPALRALHKAAMISRGGDQALAHLHLDLARLSTVADRERLAKRLALADELLRAGTTPDALPTALRLPGLVEPRLVKYDPAQSRVPAGSGRESGRWTSDAPTGEEGVSFAPAAAITSAEAAPLFAPGVGAAVLSALSSLFAAVGAVATLGVLFVPWQKSISNSGVLPGSSGATYAYDHDEGRLRIRDAAGSLLTIGQRDRSGVFYDVHTGVPFAREIDGAVVFNEDVSRPSANTTSGTDARSRAKEDTNKPKLCPAPVPDQPSGAKPRAKAYQEQVAFLVNGSRGLKFGLAIGLVNPLTGKIVHFDECQHRTGDMIEAKGPGYADKLDYASDNIKKEWLDQSRRQLLAAGKRRIIWYFAERRAAAFARKIFSQAGDGHKAIIIKIVPAKLK